MKKTNVFKFIIGLVAAVAANVKAIDERLTIHDFRMVTGTTHHNMIFDVVIPADFKLSQEELKDIIQKKVWEKWPDPVNAPNLIRRAAGPADFFEDGSA